MSSLARWVAILTVPLCTGCPLFYDLDDVELGYAEDMSVPDGAVPDPDVPADGDMVANPMDSDVPDTPPNDMAPPVDMSPPPDLGPGGMTCPGAVPLGGSCNLVAQDCPEDQICDVGLLMPGAETGCRMRTAGVTYDLALGVACSPAGTNRCQPGLLCRDNVCVRYCYADTGIGCSPDETCAPLDATNLPGVGWCTDGC